MRARTVVRMSTITYRSTRAHAAPKTINVSGCCIAENFCVAANMSLDTSVVLCPMCQFQSLTLALSLNHLRLVHGNDPCFSVRCGIGGCTYTGRSFSALYSHIYRRHSDVGVIQKRKVAVQLQEQSVVLSEEALSTPGTSAQALASFDGSNSQGK